MNGNLLRPHGWVFVIFLLYPLLGGCGDDEGGSASAGNNGAGNNGTDNNGEGNNGTDNNGAAFDEDAFCQEVFDPGDVAGILGQEDLTRVPSATSGVAGLVLCDLANPGSQIIAKLSVECRAGAGATDVALQRQVIEALRGGGGTYEEIELGRGGAYAHNPDTTAAPAYYVGFVHQTAPCAILVSTFTLEQDNVLALAEHVDPKLTLDNHPR